MFNETAYVRKLAKQAEEDPDAVWPPEIGGYIMKANHREEAAEATDIQRYYALLGARRLATTRPHACSYVIPVICRGVPK